MDSVSGLTRKARCTLPPDIMLLICEELAYEEEFDTLFSCALSGKSLVGTALLCLYRVYDQCQIFSNESLEAEIDFRKTLSKLSLVWKSIIRSSLGKTSFPYCAYIRRLDLQNLIYFLDEMSPAVAQKFFAGDMAVFDKRVAAPKGSRSAHVRRDVQGIIKLVGDSITQFTSESASQNKTGVVIEFISGYLDSPTLLRWTSRLSRLKSMTIWNGDTLNHDVARSIAANCPNFEELTMFMSQSENESRVVDPDYGNFFSGLTENTLRFLTAFNSGGIGPEALLALNHHSKSLRVLKLEAIPPEFVKSISHLQSCTAIEDLTLSTRHWNTEKIASPEVVRWLSNCELQELRLRNFDDSPALLSLVCSEGKARLRTLSVQGYQWSNAKDFYQSLVNQTALDSLLLAGSSEDGWVDQDAGNTNTEYMDTLIESLCHLTKMRNLDLSEMPIRSPLQLRRLATSLKDLEMLSFGGWNVGDDDLKYLAKFRYMKDLQVNAMSYFTYDGLTEYISTLSETNQGLAFAVMSQDADRSMIGPNYIGILQGKLAVQVDGKLEFQYWRDPNDDEESTSESD